ncbi:unnamed protein product (macronuclear) [Paramecium tetraurelia]|uniref:Uncharacterized protein n=1 Tax=Paramecium tetraurelia TaxID=5888 RepID=A0DZI1_PARTE|nr:uncharacterized protein GSPATT00021615001 [Paramecium tetraurelia]CAK88448.1 unnamed protein product [Paramecium tetraurelia]|eukprot:XP_001455845.1 hypothetical protein (macronuclear) [Paramecium tetraurelia strain d4-2]
MSTSPLTRVQSSAFANGSALRIKQKQSQTQCQRDQISPLKSSDENEQSPSKIINIYADSALYNNLTTFTTANQRGIGEEDKTLNTCTYSQMVTDEADRAQCQRQRITQDQIRKTKDQVKDKQKEFYESRQTTMKSAIKKQQIDSSTAQSQQIDLTRSSQNFRRKSIDQPPQPQIKPIKNKLNVQNQQFHLQLQSKKQQLLNDIAKLDKEIVMEQERKPVQIDSKRTQQNRNAMGSKPTYDKRQSTKKITESEQKIKQTVNTNRKMNTSQNFKISSRNSPKSAHPKRPVRSQSQEIKEYVDPLKNSREDLNGQ